MTEAQEDILGELSRGRKIAKSIRRHLINYLFIAVAGSICIMATSALIKAYRVKSPLAKAAEYLAANRSNDLLDQLETSARWEGRYPSLKPRRDALAIKCHARKGELSEAMGIADAMATASFQAPSLIAFLKGFAPPDSVKSTVDRFSYFINHMEIPIAAGIDQIFRKQNAALLLDRWSGYNDLANELKAKRDIDSIEKLLSAVQKYHPESKFTESLAKYTEETRRLANKGISLPRTDNMKNAPFGWALVNREQISVYNNTGGFLRKVTAGTLVEVDEIRNSKSGNIVIGSLRFRNSAEPDVVLLAKELSLKRGLLFEVDATVLDKLYTRAELTQKIAEANESARDSIIRSNPYYAEYTKLSADYRALWEDIDSITAKFKAAAGPEREKYADKLRILKNTNIVLGNKLKAAKANSGDWARANADKMATHPTTTHLKNQLNRLEEELKQLGHL